MDVGIAFVVGLFLGSFLGVFTFALATAAKHEDEWLEKIDTGVMDGKDYKV